MTDQTKSDSAASINVDILNKLFKTEAAGRVPAENVVNAAATLLSAGVTLSALKL